jgi:hypothetical protein
MFIITFFKNLFKRNKCKKIANKYKEEIIPTIVKDEKSYKKDHSSAAEIVAKSMRNTASDDQRVIKKITVRKLKTHEDEYLKKKIEEFDIKNINKSTYKNYCFGNRKYQNKVFSILSLYRITKGKRSDFKYVIVMLHSKNTDPKAKMKLVYTLYIDFNGEPYYGNYYRLFKNEEFINKIWKKVEKLYDSDLYEKHNKKRSY